jgi:hypothetical protein
VAQRAEARRVETIPPANVHVQTSAPPPVPVPVAAAPSGSVSAAATATARDDPAEFTDAGYRKRARKAVGAAAVDRFAVPEETPRPKSAEAMRDRLSSFTAGKSRASGADNGSADGDSAGGTDR